MFVVRAALFNDEHVENAKRREKRDGNIGKKIIEEKEIALKNPLLHT